MHTTKSQLRVYTVYTTHSRRFTYGEGTNSSEFGDNDGPSELVVETDVPSDRLTELAFLTDLGCTINCGLT